MCSGDAFAQSDTVHCVLIHICRASCLFQFPDNNFAKSQTKLQVHVFQAELNPCVVFTASFGTETFLTASIIYIHV